LQSSLHLLEPGSQKNKHTVFVDTFDQALTFEPANYFNTLPELVGRTFNRFTLDQLQTEVPPIWLGREG
jgi:U3 small nucleolar RNA-associated protein 11